MIRVEKGIPVPPRAHRYPWHQMEPGDSFFVECPPGVRVSLRQTKVNSAARNDGRRHNRAYCTRREGDGVRVWRVA